MFGYYPRVHVSELAVAMIDQCQNGITKDPLWSDELAEIGKRVLKKEDYLCWPSVLFFPVVISDERTKEGKKKIGQGFIEIQEPLILLKASSQQKPSFYEFILAEFCTLCIKLDLWKWQNKRVPKVTGIDRFSVHYHAVYFARGIDRLGSCASNGNQHPWTLRRIGWLSVLNTQSSRLMTSGSVKERYRYFSTSAK